MKTKAKRIMLAEDEVVLRDFVSRNLRARGFEVVEVSNGVEALAVWERESVHLLILDIMMPRMDGLEVCQRVREHSGVPIIVLTALDAERDKVTALDLGADDYLTKPFGVEELLARVRAVLRRAQGGRCHLQAAASNALVTWRSIFRATSCNFGEWRCGSPQPSSHSWSNWSRT